MGTKKQIQNCLCRVMLNPQSSGGGGAGVHPSVMPPTVRFGDVRRKLCSPLVDGITTFYDVRNAFVLQRESHSICKTSWQMLRVHRISIRTLNNCAGEKPG
jgi:hypothetical protein